MAESASRTYLRARMHSSNPFFNSKFPYCVEIKLPATMYGVALGHNHVLVASTRSVITPMRVRHRLVVRASDDEDIVPIVSGKKKKGFTPKEYEMLRNPTLLGGSTVGEELAIIRQKYLEAEARAEAHVAEHLSSSQWYVCKSQNELRMF